MMFKVLLVISLLFGRENQTFQVDFLGIPAARVELNIADSLFYGASGWEPLSGHHVTFISEMEIEHYIFDDRMFDLLGREYYRYKSIPVGLMYVRNGKKYIKIK